MSHFFTLLRHEVRALLFAPATYAAAVLFLLLMGFFYIVGLVDAARMVQETTVPERFLQLFWVPVWFMVPLLTMRSIAEERRLGTLETLLSTPVSAGEIVLSKFCGAYLFYLALWGLTLLFPLAVGLVSPALVEEGQLLGRANLVGGYTFIAVSGVLYTAVGLFASSLTRSQLIAGMFSFCILFAFTVGPRLLVQLPLMESPQAVSLNNVPDYLHTFQHLEDFTRGILDTRPFCFYLSNTLLLLGLTTLITRKKA